MRAASKAVLNVKPVSFQWDTLSPFIFCVHHLDRFPGQPDGSMKVRPEQLRGRNIGSDFVPKDGFRMYHGESGVPGFPQHPHAGFETITIVLSGTVDHSDSLGATARFGHAGGDVQWMTAGKGISHAEMFPLLKADDNTMELFQIWLNLPAKSKRVNPYFTMLWSEKNPVIDFEGGKVRVYADEGRTLGMAPQSPPPDSYASQPGSDLSIFLIELEAGGSWTLPAAKGGKDTSRALFVFVGAVSIDETTPVESVSRAVVDASVPVKLKAEGGKARILMLQAKPLNEPIAQRGPFVANTQQELMNIFLEYQRTRFGGWPWPTHEPVHTRDTKRFALHPDKRLEEPDKDKSEL